jgi:cytochrome P450
VASVRTGFPWQRGCPHRAPEEYGRIRAEEPIARIRLATGADAWIVTRHDHARAILTDRRASSNRAHPGFPYFFPVPDAFRYNAGFLGMDPPEHTLHRRMIAAEFTAHRVRGLRPGVERLVDELLDAMLDGPRPADLLHALALPVPTFVIGDLLGMPVSDHGILREATETMLDAGSSAERRRAALTGLNDYFVDLIAGKERSPGDDLISKLVPAYRAAGLLDKLPDLARLLLNGGHESSANMIAVGTLVMLQRPDQTALLRADPSLSTGAVEELLRYLTVADLAVGRVALEDIEIGGVVIRAGDGVLLPGAAANRDPAVFERPDELDIRRPNARQHLAFGHGVHLCIGANLTRMELDVVFSVLFRRIPTLRLAVPFEELSFRDGGLAYGVRGLPVTW